MELSSDILGLLFTFFEEVATFLYLRIGQPVQEIEFIVIPLCVSISYVLVLIAPIVICCKLFKWFF